MANLVPFLGRPPRRFQARRMTASTRGGGGGGLWSAEKLKNGGSNRHDWHGPFTADDVVFNWNMPNGRDRGGLDRSTRISLVGKRHRTISPSAWFAKPTAHSGRGPFLGATAITFHRSLKQRQAVRRFARSQSWARRRDWEAAIRATCRLPSASIGSGARAAQRRQTHSGCLQ